jgi:hypothetical protein
MITITKGPTMNIDDLTIGEAKRLAALFGSTAQPEPTADHGLCLVVADRGHVWVGRVTTDAEWAHVAGARVVRIWGTTGGLNELAAKGPLSGTKLDAPGNVKVSRRAVIALIPCESSEWSA